MRPVLSTQMVRPKGRVADMQDGANGTRGIAWLAFFLFVGGLLLPFVLYVVLTSLARMASEDANRIAIAFGAIFELLGFVLSARIV